MAYMEYRNQMAPSNYLVESRHIARAREHEYHHLMSVKKTLNTRPSSAAGTPRFNAKKELQRELDYSRVEHGNLLLLSKLHKTTTRPASAAGPSPCVSARECACDTLRFRVRQSAPPLSSSPFPPRLPPPAQYTRPPDPPLVYCPPRRHPRHLPRAATTATFP